MALTTATAGGARSVLEECATRVRADRGERKATAEGLRMELIQTVLND